MRKALALLWLVLVLAAGAHVAWTARHGLPVDSDLMSLLPQEEQDPAVRAAKRHMAQTLSRRVVVMIGHAERAEARTQAARLRAHLLAEGLIRPESDIPPPDAVMRLGAAYFPHRAGLLSDSDRRRLEAGDGQALVTRALSQVFGFGGAVDSRLLARDPLLLYPAFLAGLPAPSNRLSVDDGMLSVAGDGTAWVMESMVLTGEAFSLDVQRRFVAAYDGFAAQVPTGTRLLRLGAVFHARDGAERAMSESTRIGLVSAAGIVLLILGVFRSGRPLLLSLAAVGGGLIAALSACLALWGSLHMAAQLFGAALIGIAVDYALLYFGQVFTSRADPTQRLAKVRAGMVLGAACAVIGYGALALSPFPGLRQVALFSAVGLSASLAGVMLWFPLLDRARPRPLPTAFGRAARALWQFWDRPDRSRARRAALGLLALLALGGSLRLEVDDDMRRQQSPSPVLTSEEAELRRLAGLGQTGRFFVVSGTTEQQVLEREEALLGRLEGVSGAQAISRYVPSARRQAENAALIERALYRPHLEPYRARLGMSAASAPTPAETPLAPAEIRAVGALPFLDALRIAETLHAVLPDSGDGAALEAAAKGLDGVRWVDPTADLNALLRAYRLRALMLLAVSAAAMAPLLLWRYGPTGALRTAAPAALAVLVTPPLLALTGIGFSFFVAMALVPAFAIGNDYALFCAEDAERDPVTLFSVCLAMLTTLLSFGLLALSDTAGVRAFGAAMLCAVTLAFLLAPSVRARRCGSRERREVGP